MRRAGSFLARRNSFRGVGGAVPDLLAQVCALLGPTARCYFSDRGVTKDGADLVAAVTDTPQGLYPVTQGTELLKPKWISSVAALGGREALQYRHDGTNESGLQAAVAADWRFLHEPAGSTIIAVCQSTEASPSGSRYLLASRVGSGIGTRLNLNGTTQDLQWVVTTGAGNAIVVTAAGVGLTMRTVVARHATAATPDYDLRINGASVASGSYTATPITGEDPSFPLVFSRAAASAYWIGYIPYIALVPSYVADATITQIEALLDAHYGL